MTASERTVERIAAGVAGGEATAREIVNAAIDTAERLNGALGAFLQIDREGALRRADDVDGAAASDRGALAGVPVAIKDNICVRGLQASCGSTILGPYRPPYTATAVERLLAAGAGVVGKTNCDQFALGSSNQNS